MKLKYPLGALAVVAVGALVLTGCGSGAENVDDDSLLVWSTEVQPDRVAVTEQIIEEFTAKTGIDVELVPVEDAQMSQLVAAAALSREMPDVIGNVGLGLVRAFDGDGYVDREAAAQVVENLGAETWSESTLTLTQDGGEQLSVPSDSWTQILVYRTDLFEKAGLPAPDDYESLLNAAETLTTGSNYGISLATDPSDLFTQQTFEALALGNGCQLVDQGGTVTLDSENCAATVDLYGQLAADYSPAGAQTVDSTRASYFSGQVAMTMWSTFLLDELAGLRNDAMPSCPECVTPTYLAENTGIIPLVEGPNADGSAGTFGELASWVITSDASTDDATTFVEYMMSEGYADWFGIAPEGKFPARTGTAENPTEYIDTWATLPVGVDTRLPLADVYPPETIAALGSINDDITRWAIVEGQGALLGPLDAELPIPKIIGELGVGAVDAKTAQQQMQDAVQEIADR